MGDITIPQNLVSAPSFMGMDPSGLWQIAAVLIGGAVLLKYLKGSGSVSESTPKKKTRRRAKLGLGTVVPTVAAVGLAAYVAGKYL